MCLIALSPVPAVFCLFLFFFFNDTATTEIYTLSLHDALPISRKIQKIRIIYPSLTFQFSRMFSRLNSYIQLLYYGFDFEAAVGKMAILSIENNQKGSFMQIGTIFESIDNC